MASLIASGVIASAGGWAGMTATMGPFGLVVGSALLIGGALMDARFAAALNRQSNNPQSPRLVGLPYNNNAASQPRIWALGRRVRVPVHTIWHGDKRLVTTNTRGPKGSPGTQQQRVFVDCALAVNDRLTRGVVQMIAMGKLIYWSERKLVSIRTSQMSVANVAGKLVLTMHTTEEPDWTDKFKVDDVCALQGFVIAGGTIDINRGLWRVTAVVGHTSTPSSITLSTYSNQSLLTLSATAGTPISPAEVLRADDNVAFHRATPWPQTGAYNPIQIQNDYGIPGDKVFSIGEEVVVEFYDGPVNGWVPAEPLVTKWTVIAYEPTTRNIFLKPEPDPYTIWQWQTFVWGTSSSCSRVRAKKTSNFTFGILPNSFVPAQHYYAGLLTQDPDPTIVASEGADSVPGYRGTAYQVLDDFDCTMFGGAVPPQLEALIDIDYVLTWAEAVREVCVHFGLDAAHVDVSGVPAQVFEGMYLRGVMEGANALQSLLVAGQLACQDRDGVLSFFHVDDSDVVAIENGAVFSDLMNVGDGDGKFEFGDASYDDVPSSIGITHQDVDNFYGDGYQVFGTRFPSALGIENRRDFNLDHIALTQRQTLNLAATLMRRAHVAARTVRLRLPAAYLDVLENDVLTFTDDEGNDFSVRVLRRTTGANFEVQIEGVTEQADLAVHGSPVQSTAGRVLTPPARSAPIVGRVLDLPPLRDVDARTPGLLLCGGPTGGGTWSGCTVYRSIDAGANWSAVGTLSYQATVGVTETLLESGPPGETHGMRALTWDTVNTVDIVLDGTGLIPLVSLSVQNVLDGFGWWCIESDGGVEIFAARTVTQTGVGRYTLSTLLRGLRGTIAGCGVDHAAGARITMVSSLADLEGLWLDCAGLQTQPVQEYRFVAPGEDVSDTPSVSLVAKWRNVLPFPVRDVTKAINGVTSVRFTVNHWTRLAMPLGWVGPYPLDEPYEAYRFDLWHASGASIVYRRTITSRSTGARALRDRWVEFSAAECSAAGYTLGPGETFWLDVVQIGDYGESPSNLTEY